MRGGGTCPSRRRCSCGSANPLELRERLRGHRTERIIGKWVDRADVDFAEDVGVRTSGVPLAVEKIRIPQDRQFRLVYTDQVTQLAQPLSLQPILERLEIRSGWWVVKAWTRLRRRADRRAWLGRKESIYEL